jgi:hypothetical protein
MLEKDEQPSPQKLTPSRSSFLRRNWLTILVGILGIGSTCYFYQLSISEKEPIFLIDPIRTIVINSKSLPKTTLKIAKENDIPVQGDIISIRFYFWNNGKQTIRKEHILTPLILSLSDKGGEILDYKLLSLSRKEVINAMIERNELEPKTSLNITFRILEKHDGFTGQIIYSGDPNSELIMKGVIEGVKAIKTNASLSRFGFYKHMSLNLVLPLLLIIICIVIPFWLLVFKKGAGEKFADFVDRYLTELFDRISPRVGKLFAIVIPIVFLIVLAWFYGEYTYKQAQEEINKNLPSIVPSQIRP